MHLPLQDLLDGAMQTLRAEILPAIESRRARGQLHCVLDLLANLRDRITYDASLFEAEVLSASDALGAVRDRLAQCDRAEAAREVAELMSHVSDAPPQARAEALRAAVARSIVIVARSVPDDHDARAALDRHLLEQTIRDVILLKPPPLDEISKG